MLLNVSGTGSRTLFLGDYGRNLLCYWMFWYCKRYIISWRLWHLVFGIRNLVLRFGIDCWKPEFGLRFSEVSGVILALQHYLPFMAQGGHWFHREDIDSAGRILTVYLLGWRMWHRAVSSTEEGGCWLCLCKTRRRCQFRIIREFQW